MKRFEQFRLRRRKIYEELFGARFLFIAGLAVMPAMLFITDTKLKIFQFLFFWLLAWLSGKKNNPFITLLVIISITAFNLIVPYGRVLFSIGFFQITEGALETGIHRALTLEGLIMLSRVTIRRNLKIPGFFGELLGESFRIFAEITERKQRITGKNFIADIDRLMIELSGTPEQGESGGEVLSALPESGETKPAGFIIAANVVLLSWFPWAFVLLRP